MALSSIVLRGHSHCHEAFNIDRQCLWDYAIKFAKWQHHAVKRGRAPNAAHWGDGVSASCTVGPIVRVKVRNTLRTIGSCQSAATSEIVKRCWSRV